MLRGFFIRWICYWIRRRAITPIHPIVMKISAAHLPNVFIPHFVNMNFHWLAGIPAIPWNCPNNITFICPPRRSRNIIGRRHRHILVVECHHFFRVRYKPNMAVMSLGKLANFCQHYWNIFGFAVFAQWAIQLVVWIDHQPFDTMPQHQHSGLVKNAVNSGRGFSPIVVSDEFEISV